MWVWLVQGLRGVGGPGGTLSGVWQEGTGVAECGVQGVPPLNWSHPLFHSFLPMDPYRNDHQGPTQRQRWPYRRTRESGTECIERSGRVRRAATDNDEVRETGGKAEGVNQSQIRVPDGGLPPQDRPSLSAPGLCSEVRGPVSWESPWPFAGGPDKAPLSQCLSPWWVSGGSRRRRGEAQGWETGRLDGCKAWRVRRWPWGCCPALPAPTFCPGEMRALTCFSTGFRELS